MAKGMYAAIGGTTKKIKKNYAVVGGTTRKIKKMYAVVNGITKLIFSGSPIGKATGIMNTYPIVINNPDGTDDSKWTCSARTDELTLSGSAFTSYKTDGALTYAFGRYYTVNSTGLVYSTDGVTYTQCPEVTICDSSVLGGYELTTASVTNLLNCNGRLFGAGIHYCAGGGNQSGGGGQKAFFIVELNSSSEVLQYTYDKYYFSSTNSGYGGGHPEGNFDRSYTQFVYHNGYIYFGMYERSLSDGDGYNEISLQRYNIASNSIETLIAPRTFFTETSATSYFYNPGLYLYDDTLLLTVAAYVYVYDINASTFTRLSIYTATINDTTSAGEVYRGVRPIRINHDTFVWIYSTNTYKVYQYNDTALTLIETVLNSKNFNTGAKSNYDENFGERYVMAYFTRTSGSKTNNIILRYTLDGVTVTEDTLSITTPSEVFSNTASGTWAFNLYFVPN